MQRINLNNSNYRKTEYKLIVENQALYKFKEIELTTISLDNLLFYQN